MNISTQENPTASLTVENEWTNRLIAFIDILGFKEYINTLNTIEDKQDCLSLLNFLQAQRSSFVDQKVYGEIKRPNLSVKIVKTEPEVSSFSDHCIFSIPTDLSCPEKFVKGFNGLIETLYNITLELLLNGFPIRGAISLDSAYHSGNLSVGKGINEAIELESNVAIYPRIVFSDTVINFFEQHRKERLIYYSVFKRDIDEVIFFDFFSFLRKGDVGGDYFNLLKIREVIDKNMNKLKTKRQSKIFQKWAWLASYFNEALSDWYNHNQGKISALEIIKPIEP